MLTHIKNARICTSDCKGFTQGELFIVDGKIANNPTNFKADVVIDFHGWLNYTIGNYELAGASIRSFVS